MVAGVAHEAGDDSGERRALGRDIDDGLCLHAFEILAPN